MKRLAPLLPALLPCLWGCGASSLLDSTAPWIKVAWISTHGLGLSPQQVGSLRVTAGAYGSGNQTVTLVLDRNQSYTPGHVSLDAFGTATTTLGISGATCASGVTGAVFDTLTARMSVSGTVYSTRLGIACQDALR